MAQYVILVRQYLVPLQPGERQGRREHEERADAKHAGPMVERPVDILHHIGCLKNRAKQSAHHFLRRCIRSSEERSEEHTSELQSLMRISYAVFCLKTKQTSPHTKTDNPTQHHYTTK